MVRVRVRVRVRVSSTTFGVMSECLRDFKSCVMIDACVEGGGMGFAEGFGNTATLAGSTEAPPAGSTEAPAAAEPNQL